MAVSAKRMVSTLLGVTALGLLAKAAWGVPAAMGAAARGSRADRISRSPQFRDGKFRNEHPSQTLPSGDMADLVRRYRADKPRRKPRGVIPLVARAAETEVPADGLHVTWYGHATALVEIEGSRVLFDPVWSDRVSPSATVGPKRLHPVPVSVEQLPQLDAIVISHDHYDHLDLPTVRALLRTQSAPFVVPLGIGAHLERWQIPADRIVELDWEESAEAGALTLTATAAQHFSGRGLSRDETLWASWVVAGRKRRVFYSGDTGYFDGFAKIGENHGPFDVALVQIGAYDPLWPDIHMTPEQGVATHMDVQAHVLIPVHWATFTLAPHAWGEPVDRLWREAKAQGVTLVVPRPGERVDIDHPPAVDGWWQTL